MTRTNPTTRTIAILALPGVQLLDVAGPLDVFAEANTQTKRESYRLLVFAETPGTIVSSSGTRLMPDRTIADPITEPVHTLLVAGCPHAPDATLNAAVTNWLRQVAPQTRRYGSVCSGAFFLARAGLLDGKRVTTHWAVADRLAEAFPAVTVDADAIHVRDGKARTAAGVTAGLDLALALVEEDLGRDLAMRVAGQLVMFFKRPGGQLQFSRKGESQPAGRSILQEIQRFIAASPSSDHSISALAARAGLSPRHFARLFRHEIGGTPAAWVESARVSTARRLLEDGHDAPKQVAALCGFANADTLRRAFTRHVGVTPAAYRKQYSRV
ncbi:GlxA family transcriptional regulator [Acidisphaera sp. S103]|uniref:GlxA family transcriptional regulator n=1 Tax=Acidisphaera sp. S103 TaxID=1747223 RepID=UPI00131CFA2F|nr:GlxA family transcriptional regulator [Acidisphaera sp. S103]